MLGQEGAASTQDVIKGGLRVDTAVLELCLPATAKQCVTGGRVRTGRKGNCDGVGDQTLFRGTILDPALEVLFGQKVTIFKVLLFAISF